MGGRYCVSVKRKTTIYILWRIMEKELKEKYIAKIGATAVYGQEGKPCPQY